MLNKGRGEYQLWVQKGVAEGRGCCCSGVKGTDSASAAPAAASSSSSSFGASVVGMVEGWLLAVVGTTRVVGSFC